MTNEPETPISDWRKRVLTGLRVPVNENTKMDLVTSSFHDHLISSDIMFAERVHGSNSRQQGFVMMVDDDGRDRGQAWNPRAHFLSGYPIQAPIIGNALFFSEGFVDDGMETLSLHNLAINWLRDPARLTEYGIWLKKNRDYAFEYRTTYPLT